MNPKEVHVELTSGESETYDRVNHLDGGWISCWVRLGTGNSKNVCYPPHAVEKTHAVYERRGRTSTALERLGAEAVEVEP